MKVSGPAAGLTVLIYQTAQQYGPLALAVVVVACGLFQVIFGYLKMGSLFTLVPFSMLHGMLTAIHVPWAKGTIWLFSIGAVLSTNLLIGFALSGVFALILILFKFWVLSDIPPGQSLSPG